MSNKMTKNETLTLKMPSLGFIKSHDRGMFTVSNTLKCLIADEAVSLRLESRIFSLSCCIGTYTSYLQTLILYIGT